MSTPAGTLEVMMRMGLARLSQDITQAKGMVGTLARDVDRAANTMKSALGAIGLGLSAAGLVAFARSAINAIDRLDELSQVTKIAVTDLAGLRYAAKIGGTDLEALATSINKLAVNMGRDGEKFRALGVTAKEPLEAFKQLSNVFVAIQDPQQRAAVMAEALGKSWERVAPLLAEGGSRIGELVQHGKEFSGITEGMVKQSAEFNDKLDALAAIGMGGVNGALEKMLPLLNHTADGMIAASKGASVWQLAASGLAEVLRVLIVVGGNVAFVIHGIATEVQGIGAQLVALARGDLKGFTDIGRTMKADAEAARLAFDKWEAGILSAGSAAGVAGAQIKGMSEEEYEAARIAGEAGKAFLAGAEATKKATKAKQDLALMDEHVIAYMKELATLDIARVKRLEEQAAAEDALNKIRFDAQDSFEEMVKQMEFEVTLLGKSNAERQVAIALRQLEKAGIDTNTDAVRAYADRIRDAVTAQESFHAQASIWDELSSAAGNFFSDLVMNGKSAFDNLKKWVKQLLAEMIALFAKRWVLNMAAGGSVLGSAGDALAGGSGIGSIASSGLSLFSSGGTIAGAYGAFTAGAQGATLAAGLAGPTTAGAGGMMGAGASLSGVYSALAAIPVWGWIAMAVIGAIAFFSGRGGGPKPGGSFMGDYDSQGNFIGTSSVPGTDNGRFFTPTSGDSAMRDFTTQFATGFFDTLTRYGGTTSGLSFGFGFDQDPEGRADSRVSSMVRDSSGNVIYSNTATAGRDDEDFQRAMGLETSRAIVAGLQASDLPESIALIFDSIDPLTATAEQLAQAFKDADLGMSILALGIKGLDFQTLQNFQANGETLEETFQRVGGAWAWFQQNFTTDAERLTRAQQEVNDVFATLGIEIPTSTTAFRQLVEGLDLSTESGRAMFTMLMGVAPAFLTVTNAADALTDSTDGLTDSLNDAVVMTLELQQRIQDDVRRSRESQLDSVIGARGGLQDFLNGVKLDQNLTTLDPMARLAEARRQYEEVLGLARGGDLGAAGRLGGSAQTYLQIAREMFASSGAYGDIFDRVTGEVEGVDARLEIQQHILEATLGMAYTMTEVRDLLLDIRDGGTAGDAKVAKSVDNSALATARR